MGLVVVIVWYLNLQLPITTYNHKSHEFEPRSWRGVLDITLRDQVCQWLSPCTPPIKLTVTI